LRVTQNNWSEYTITLKARKTDGENGFQIYFHHQQGTNSRIRWDIGGYNNSINELKTFVNSESVPYKVEEGRWYDIRLEVSPLHIRGYIDGKLVQEFTGKNLNTKAVCASASQDAKTGDVIVKVVNSSEKAVPATINLKGIKNAAGKVDALLLTSDKGTDENTLDQSKKVAPREYKSVLKNGAIVEKLPANSLVIYRIHK